MAVRLLSGIKYVQLYFKVNFSKTFKKKICKGTMKITAFLFCNEVLIKSFMNNNSDGLLRHYC